MQRRVLTARRKLLKLVARATLGFINRLPVGWYLREELESDHDVTTTMVGNRDH